MSAETDARQQALKEIGDALRTLAANLISIVRGAGRPLELNPNVESLAAALAVFEKIGRGHPKAWEFADMLRADLEPRSQHPRPQPIWRKCMHNTISSRHPYNWPRHGC